MKYASLFQSLSCWKRPPPYHFILPPQPVPSFNALPLLTPTPTPALSLRGWHRTVHPPCHPGGSHPLSPESALRRFNHRGSLLIYYNPAIAISSELIVVNTWIVNVGRDTRLNYLGVLHPCIFCFVLLGNVNVEVTCLIGWKLFFEKLLCRITFMITFIYLLHSFLEIFW